MKLFAKYNRINLISTVIIFLLGCVAFSLLIRYVIINQVDEDLKIEKNEIVTYIKRFNQMPSVVEAHDQYTTYKTIEKPVTEVKEIFTSREYNKDEHEKELRRIIEFNININNNWYLVSVSKSLEGTDELIQTIIVITIGLILLILAATFVINRFVLKTLWQPFYDTLQRMQLFNLSSSKKINFDTTNIDEFKYLNSSLTQTLNKAQNDYQSLKEFTENASHELQTPLAVIQSKLDILIQNDKLSETESKTIQGAYDAVQNLKKLNQSLLLLAKIENNQFSELTQINLSELLHSKLIQFSDLWRNMYINTEVNIEPLTIRSNAQLMDILLNNLLSNATKHNHQHGSISVKLQDKTLNISNSGSTSAINEKFLFKRFSKNNISGEGYGLGLSIIKQICDVSGYICSYNFNQPDKHTFLIKWAS
jgi:signal transduction histidine kinase